eukprot:TRINITY_DN2717_c0_g1_i1.p3 TRINITY_DN2717_c0_g1~~TRINITY_DN2717_c0_g1_i1.p3  ORF type:complete len:107 (+),score=19.47 TRINITY_DN2717_c0_g1_i1:128-448(+)
MCIRDRVSTQSTWAVPLEDKLEIKFGNQIFVVQVNENSVANPSQQQQQPVDTSLCIICQNNKINTTFGPCQHSIACSQCASQYILNQSKLCPLCKQSVSNFYMKYD